MVQGFKIIAKYILRRIPLKFAYSNLNMIVEAFFVIEMRVILIIFEIEFQPVPMGEFANSLIYENLKLIN